MAAEQRVGDMTIEELKALINQAVEQRTSGVRQLGGKRSIAEINASVDKHLWTPPPDTPSLVVLIREDRDR